MGEEMVEVVNERGETLGSVPRREAHRDPALLHRVVHVLVFGPSGGLLLQKRGAGREVAPGKWDTSVGGHVSPGESVENAARREALEELGIDPAGARFLYRWVYRNTRESELVHTFGIVHGGPFEIDREEVEQVDFWPLERIGRSMGTGVFSGQFEEEFSRYRRWARRGGEFP